MDSHEGPIPMGWFTAGGHPDFWSEDGKHATYMPIPYGDLPQLDRSRHDGTLAWLPALPEDDGALAFEDLSLPPADTLRRLAEEAAGHGFLLPESFVGFISKPELHTRVPTCTACYLELSKSLIAAPSDPQDRLLRFMHDQQCCLLWYLYLRPQREPAVVVATPEWHEQEVDGDTLEDMISLTDPRVCAPTFEDFVHRFWIENAIWYALHRSRPLTAEQADYVAHAQRVKTRSPKPSSS